ncbi:M50 family metallopeptidase [Ornithinimicrobium sp. INDO-MA30-4]|uniref:M50 family metallopeptidase n=1 Tax=Ornithinimicrobium sp. INDO-MA30-4 TaxID=2908651 RepID=UPI001F24B164|nr:M50 family metallopeptidase [Ornithinimicrobium sp. INDO-MA30-4]UJH70374.1 M50 family metallopeptidase [Ornithinimicrobium sp. INDO-MA30-4]
MLAVIGYAALAIWVAVIVHEVGHYLAGLAAGVPARAMRVRMEAPPHVDLGDGEVWLSPDDEEYVEVFRQYASSAGAAWLFVAGDLCWRRR